MDRADMTAPSNANTSGLEVVAWRRHDVLRKGAYFADRKETAQMWSDRGLSPDPLVTAASAQARIAELEAELSQANANGASHWSRATAAEARADRLAKALERIRDADPYHVSHPIARAATQQEG